MYLAAIFLAVAVLVSGCSTNEAAISDRPVLMVITPASPANENSPVIHGSANAGDTVSIFATPDCSGDALIKVQANEDETFEAQVTVGDNTMTVFSASAKTKDGKESECSAENLTYIEDSLAPGKPTLTEVQPVSPANNPSPVVRGTADAGSTVEIYLNTACTGTPAATLTADTTGQFQTMLNVAEDAMSTFRARAVDKAGNASSCSNELTYIEDSTAPMDVALLGTQPPTTGLSKSNDSSPEILGSTSAGAFVRIYTDMGCTGTVAGSDFADNMGQFSITVNVAPDSTTTFFAKAEDAAGNQSACSPSVTYFHTSCVTTDPNDQPDPAFIDTNCDGIDGNISDAIFVSAASGSDANPGTTDQPKATINSAISAALSTGRKQVLIASGTYNGRVTLTSGISLFGHYNEAGGWSRVTGSDTFIRGTTALNARVSALEGFNITTPTVIGELTIQTLSTSNPGISNYAFYCSNCPAVTLRGSVIQSGNAGGGLSGTNGSAGANGGNGQAGFAGSCDGPNGSGGLGGSSTVGRQGGNGGAGGSEGANSGAGGSTGVIGTPGGVGGSGGNPGGNAGSGVNGSSGAIGANGVGGNGGSIVVGFWSTSNGSSGLAGTHGNGGGGGGGGGGQGGSIFVNDGGGNGGGGGGAGGAAGIAGTGGTGGGGSFGVFLVNSTGFQLVNNQISSGNGGNGGSGGTGGNGGAGGFGGQGATACASEIGIGGNGGNGGAGGRGGHGGGGAGGPSYGVFRSSTTLNVTGNLIVSGNGGAGGPSFGSPGSNGSSGSVF